MHYTNKDATFGRLKQLAADPSSGPAWREQDTLNRYRKGDDGTDGVITACPGKGPKGTPGGIALRMPETILA